jgi:hypothetical protein
VYGSFGNEYNVALAICHNKTRLTVRTTAVIDISRNISFSSSINNEGTIKSEKISGMQALGTIARLSEIADPRSQQLPGISAIQVQRE